jgi:hypothetical protein
LHPAQPSLEKTDGGNRYVMASSATTRDALALSRISPNHAESVRAHWDNRFPAASPSLPFKGAVARDERTQAQRVGTTDQSDFVFQYQPAAITHTLIYRNSKLAAKKQGVSFIVPELELLQLENWNTQIWKLYNIQDNQLLGRTVAVIGNFGARIHV